MLNIAAFLSYVFTVTFTPGPNNILAMATANRFGFRTGFRFNLGVFTGFAVIMLLANYFNLMLISLVPKLQLVIRPLGAAYMGYLAYKIGFSRGWAGPKDGNPSNPFLTGVTLQLANVKVILYAITVTSTFIIPNYQSNLALTSFSVCLAFVALVSTTCWATFGLVFQRFLSSYERPFNLVMGLLLAYSALSILLSA